MPMFREPIRNGMATQPVQRAQVENLYVEAMLLADEAHAAFRAHRDFEAVARDPILQVGLACESLKTTTRLMHIIAWLLHRRAMFGAPVPADHALCAHFDDNLQRIVAASERLFDRIARIEAGWTADEAARPVQALLAQLEARL
jgi:regulator of CtrA degradation